MAIVKGQFDHLLWADLMDTFLEEMKGPSMKIYYLAPDNALSAVFTP